MTALLERAPAPPVTRPARRVTTALFVVALGLAAYTGFRLPGAWAVTLQTASLADGFHRRFLIGTLLHPFAAIAGYHYWLFAAAAFLILAALLTVITVAFLRSRTESARFVLIGWLLVPSGGYLFHEVGYYDQAIYLLLFAALFALHRNRPVVASGLMVLSVLTHEIALLTVLPVFALVLLQKMPFRRVCTLVAPPAVAGLIVLALPPAAPGAIAKFQQKLADAQFPFRDDALRLFARTQVESWRIYSITDVLLYLVPILLVVIGGYLILHRDLLSVAAIVAPALLAFGGWDEARWGFLLVCNFAVVLFLRLQNRELRVAQLGALAAAFLILTHIPMAYFDGYTPREITLVGKPHAVGVSG
ncbi:hypothetical protein [Amycolatopsis jejuensis]|uniref:hypothetical protein n=1 Tax=Amycolatopsis jejuensis TaxID=330084 RepID=UPI000526C6D4|nr:hypothetical protein [Amycolatopsis jejuensis]